MAIAVAVLIILVIAATASCSSGGLSPNPADPSPSSATASSTSAGDMALGRSIYIDGRDLSGRVVAREGGVGMMGSGSCASCHGTDGRGGTYTMMMVRYEVPDIRWSVLSQPMEMGGETEPAYDAATFARAVRDGIGSDGDELEAIMPRWQLTDPEVNGLIAYLQSL